MSPELEALLDQEAAAQQAEAAALPDGAMLYRTRRAGLLASSTFRRPYQL
jgi:hypothetical protein